MKAKPQVQLNVRQLRLKHRWTQAELARRSRLSKTTISHLESGKLARVELSTIAQLCEAFECTPNELFSVSGPSEFGLRNTQQQALQDLIGSITYATPLDPDRLDADLATLTDEAFREAAP